MKAEGGPAGPRFRHENRRAGGHDHLPSVSSAAKCHWLENHHDDARRMLPRRSIIREDRPPTMPPPMSLDLPAQLDGFAVLFEEPGDHLLLPRQLARQRVDLGLAFGGQGCEL